MAQTPTVATAEQLASIFDVTTRTVNRWIAAGLAVVGVYAPAHGKPKALYAVEDVASHRTGKAAA